MSVLPKRVPQIKILTENYLEHEDSRETQSDRYTRGIPHNFFSTVKKLSNEFTMVSALGNKIVMPFQKNDFLKFSVPWKVLIFKMLSFCKVDPKCDSSFVQCICNGV